MAPPWRTFGQTVTGLMDRLAAGGVLATDRVTEAVHAITSREASASTAILDIAVGVPHARLQGLAEPAVALAASRAGLYEAVPTVLIQIVALVLSPPDANAEHLELLASVATLRRSRTVRADLLRTTDAATATALLQRHGRASP